MDTGLTKEWNRVILHQLRHSKDRLGDSGVCVNVREVRGGIPDPNRLVKIRHKFPKKFHMFSHAFYYLVHY